MQRSDPATGNAVMKAGAAALCATLALCEPTAACHPPNDLSDRDIAAADSAFIGRIVGLRFGDKFARSLPERVRIVSFEVLRMVRGKQLSGVVEVYALGGSFMGFPSSSKAFLEMFGPEVEVGIIFPDRIRASTSCSPKNAVTGNGKGYTATLCRVDLPVMLNYGEPGMVPLDRPWIVGTTCTVPYVLPTDAGKLRYGQRLGGAGLRADSP